jgi:hypothetical protein
MGNDGPDVADDVCGDVPLQSFQKRMADEPLHGYELVERWVAPRAPLGALLASSCRRACLPNRFVRQPCTATTQIELWKSRNGAANSP